MTCCASCPSIFPPPRFRTRNLGPSLTVLRRLQDSYFSHLNADDGSIPHGDEAVRRSPAQYLTIPPYHLRTLPSLSDSKLVPRLMFPRLTPCRFGRMLFLVFRERPPSGITPFPTPPLFAFEQLSWIRATRRLFWPSVRGQFSDRVLPSPFFLFARPSL